MLVPVITNLDSSFNATSGHAYFVPMTTGTPVCTLPDAAVSFGLELSVTVNSVSNGRLSFATINDQLINGQSASSLPGLIKIGQSYTFNCDGSNWLITSFSAGTGAPNSVLITGGAPSLSWQGPLAVNNGGTGTT